MHLRTLQTNLPWTIHYHHDFRATPMAHKDFAHALVHVVKAAGILSELVNRAEHAGCDFIPEDTDKYVADLVVCALRMANTCPGRTIDLERAVIERIESKNGVKLPAEEFPVRVIVDNTHTEEVRHLKAEIGVWKRTWTKGTGGTASLSSDRFRRGTSWSYVWRLPGS